MSFRKVFSPSLPVQMYIIRFSLPLVESYNFLYHLFLFIVIFMGYDGYFGFFGITEWIGDFEIFQSLLNVRVAYLVANVRIYYVKVRIYFFKYHSFYELPLNVLPNLTHIQPHHIHIFQIAYSTICPNILSLTQIEEWEKKTSAIFIVTERHEEEERKKRQF